MKQPPSLSQVHSLSHSHQMFLSQTASIQRIQVHWPTTHSVTSPLLPSPPIPVPSHLPHHIVSQPLKKAILKAQDEREENTALEYNSDENEFDSLHFIRIH